MLDIRRSRQHPRRTLQGRCVIRVQPDGLSPLGQGLRRVELAFRCLSKMRGSFLPAARHQQHGRQIAVRGFVVRIQFQDLSPLRGGRFVRAASSADKPRCSPAGNSRSPARRSRRKPSGGMFTNSGMFTARLAAVAFSIRIGRTVVAFRVDVREIHLRVGRPALGREHQPAAVGRKAVPGIHARRCCTACAAPSRRPPAQCITGCRDASAAPLRHFTKTIHRPSGRYFGEGVAHAVPRRAAIGSGTPPWPSRNGIR